MFLANNAVSFLPDLLGALLDVVRAQSSDDTIVVLITFLYELDLIPGLF